MRFKQLKALESDPLIKWCPRPGCGGYVRGLTLKDHKVVCQCGEEICFQCGNAYHGKTSCSDKIDS